MSRVERNYQFYEDNNSSQPAAKPAGGFKVAIGRLLGFIGIVIMLLMVAVIVGLTIPRFAGYDAYVVVSGSMEPTIPVGSVVFSKGTDPAQLAEGDVIVFRNPSRGNIPITHRVVSNDTSTATIITKGDANEQEDVDPLTYENVIGKVGMHVPKLGFIASSMASILGKLVAVLMLVEAWLLTEIGRRLKAS